MHTMKELKEAGTIPPRAAKLSPQDKEVMADAETEFTITGVTHNPSGENGAYWTVSADVDGLSTQFDLQSHISRDPQMAALMALSQEEPITGCVLKKLSERMGNAFLVIEAAGE